jgi:hypothetical protein
MLSSEMLHRVDLMRTDVSEDFIASLIRITRIGELRLLVVAKVVLSSSILVTLMMEATRSSETSILTRITRRNMPQDDIVHCHRREYLKSYTFCAKLRTDFRGEFSNP